MIAITAYTEPIPVETAIHDLPQPENSEDNEERSGFAEILAGLMHNVQSAEIPETESGLDTLGIEKTKDGSKLNIFANAADNTPDDRQMFDLADLSGAETLESSVDKIISADHLLGALDTAIPIDEIAGAESLDTEALKKLSDIAALSKNDLLAKNESALQNASEKQANDPASQLMASLESDAKKKLEESYASSDKKKNASGDQPSSDTVKNDKPEAFLQKNKPGEENASLFGKNDENPGKLDEFRRSRKDRVSFEVRDLRTSGISANAEQSYSLVETSAAKTTGQAGVQEVTLDLRLPDYSHNSQAQTSWETKANFAMENMLARELHQNFNGDIVRHASMILKNGGEGIIKIALHPETLGHVKIHLEMSENKITGIIVVESEEALNSFRREIAALEQAFKDAGYADASLDLSLSSNGTGGGEQELEDGTFAMQMAASSYEGSFDQGTESVIDVYFGHKTGAVNMLA